MKKSLDLRGFTLIELLVVIVIVGILAVVFLPRLIGSTTSARDAKRVAAIQRLKEALDNDLQSSLDLPASGCITDTRWGDYVAVLGGEVPTDPLGTQNTWLLNLRNITGSVATCDGSYMYVINPGIPAGTSSYSYGLFAKMELAENGNAKCSDIFISTSILQQPAVDADSCYAVLQAK